MGNIFSADGLLGRILGRFTDLLTVSILWLICSIPLVTLGASTTALYTMTLRMVRGDEGKWTEAFFKAFRRNLKQATVIHVILTMVGVLIWFYRGISGILPGAMSTFFGGVSLLFVVLWLMEVLFVYPVQARFENTVKNTMKNAWIMAAGNLHIFLMTVLITALPALTLFMNTVLFVRTFPLWVLAGPGVLAWLNSFLFQQCFKRYIPAEEEEEAGGMEESDQ